MLDWTDLENGQKVDIDIKPIQMKIENGMYGWTYTLIGMTKDKKKVRVHFSSLNEQKQRVLVDSGILEFDTHLVGRTCIDLNSTINVKGTFDGYKIKRAKIELLD